jgi:spermidine synthase
MRPLGFALSMFLSGAAALIFEILWVRRLGDLLGQDIYAITIVLTVFFAGLGLGGWWWGRLADRCNGAISLYLCLEVLIATSGVLFDPMVRWLDRLYTRRVPAALPWHFGLALEAVLAFLVLAIPTSAMGGTMTVLSRHVITQRRRMTERFGWLYGANTLGGACGVLAGTYALIPWLGVGRSMRVTAVLNVGAAVVAWLTSVPSAWRATDAGSAAPAPRASSAVREGRAIPLFVALAVGFVSIGFELLWTRGLSMRFTSGVYSFATILFAYLLSMAVGALLVGLLDRQGLVTRPACAAVLILTGLAGLVSPALLVRIPQTWELLRANQHASLLAVELRQFVRAALVMTPALVLCGLNLPIVVRLATRNVRYIGGSTGRVYLCNAIGAASAPFVVGFIVVPRIGLNHGVVLLGALLLVVGVFVVWPWARGGWRPVWPVAVLAPVVVACVWLGQHSDLRVWRSYADAQLVAYREGVAAAVSVIDVPQRGRMLQMNFGYILGGSYSGFAQRRQGLWPFVLQPEASRALIIGLGTGTTAGAAYQVPGLRIDALEIVPDVFGMLDYFRMENFGLTDAAQQDDRLRLLSADARHFVRASPDRYDVIIGDLFEPWRRGTGAMYSVEHFEAVNRILTEHGTFWQWLPLYQLSDAELRGIVRSFCRVFVDVNAWWLVFNAERPAMALVGSAMRQEVRSSAIERRLDEPALRQEFLEAGFAGPGPVVGSWIAGRAALEAFAGSGPTNTLDHPFVEFSAPQSLAARGSDWGVDNMQTLFAVAEGADNDSTAMFPDRNTQTLATAYRGSVKLMMSAHHFLLSGDVDASVDEALQAFVRTPEWDYPILFLGFQLERALAEGSDGRFDNILAVLAGQPPLDYLVEYWHARRALRDGDVAGARTYLRKAVELNPQHVDSVQLLRDVDQMSPSR